MIPAPMAASSATAQMLTAIGRSGRIPPSSVARSCMHWLRRSATEFGSYRAFLVCRFRWFPASLDSRTPSTTCMLKVAGVQ